MPVSERDQRIIDECKDTDEPVIVLRGKDKHASDTVNDYLNHVIDDPATTTEFEQAVMERRDEFDDWAEMNRVLLHSPDLREGESHHA
jgi:hypothetical protein